jgi:hypothetical protein
MVRKPLSNHLFSVLRAITVTAIVATGCGPMSTRQMTRNPTMVSAPVGRLNPPELVRLRNGRYRMASDWHVTLNGQSWKVPKGYRTNGITAPSWVKTSLGDGVQHPETWAAVFHDWLFTQPGVSRATADGLFHEMLLGYGVSSFKARLMFGAVTTYSASKTNG